MFPLMTGMISKHPSVADVARRAGVSKATAARVLGRYGRVSDKTRSAVEMAAAALDYRPNELARSMTTGRTDAIGVVVGDIGNPFFSLAVRGISEIARQHGFGVILANSDENADEERKAIRRLLSWRVDGLIVSPASVVDSAHLREITGRGLPLTLLDRDIPELNIDSATTDDRAAAEKATRLLLDRGHRNIAYVTSCLPDEGLFTAPVCIKTGSVRQRIEGFLAACAQAGITDAAQRIGVGAATPALTQDLVLRLLQQADRPTAIIASDSLVALEIYKAVQALGFAMPRDVSLVTFYDADWTAVASPTTTAISQPAREMGEMAATLVINRMKNIRAPARKLIIPTRMIERSSVADLSRLPG